MTSLLSQISPLAVVLPLLALLSIYYIVGAILNARRLRDFPGPPLARYSRAWMCWQSIKANTAETQFAALEKYGCPARLGPDLLVIDDPEMIRHFNAPGSGWRRSKWYDAMRFDPRLDTVFSTRDEKVHADLKAREAAAYNGREVATLEADVDTRLTDFIHLIREKYNGTALDMASLARYFTLDVLSTIAFGRPFGFMAANDDLWGFAAANNGYMGVLELQSNHKFFYWLFHTRLMQFLFAPKTTDTTGFGPALAFARAAVAERFGPNPTKKKDMLGHFVARDLSQLRCETEAFLQIVAGSDSTTTVLRCTMYMLAGNPAAYAKLRAEVDRAVEDGTINPESIVTYADTQKMTYLNAVLSEALRMWPPLFGMKSKIAPEGGDTVSGVYFPGGTEVCICDTSMCRRKDIFGPDSHLFRPERWLEASPEDAKRYSRTVDSLFGTGRFQCLGKHIATMELNKAIVELVRNFDWMLANPMQGIVQVSHGIHHHSDMNMVATPRNHDASTTTTSHSY